MAASLKIPEVKLIPVQDIKFDETNPNEMNQNQFKALKKNISKYGFIVPIITNSDFVVVDGEHRLRAAIDLGFKEVPVICLPLKVVDQKILRQVLNKLRGVHNKKKDAIEFSFLEREGLLPELSELMAVSEQDFRMLIEKETDYHVKEDKIDINKLYEQQGIVVKKGDLWQLGRHKLFCGDSRDLKSFQVLFADNEKADLIFTDSPFNVNYSYGTYVNGRKQNLGIVFNDNLKDDEFIDFLKSVFSNALQFCKQDLMVFCCFSTLNFSLFEKAFNDVGLKLHHVVVWIKEHFAFKRGQYPNFHRTYEPIMVLKRGKPEINKYVAANSQDVWNLSKEDFLARCDSWFIHRDNIAHYLHPTQKPIRFAENGLRLASMPGDLVLDVFAGSGSTLLACEQMNRKCYSIELDPKYCHVIIKRWEELTGKKAVLVGNYA